eukprot:15379601-Alexandrium_andersonii.AAC.1
MQGGSALEEGGGSANNPPVSSDIELFPAVLSGGGCQLPRHPCEGLREPARNLRCYACRRASSAG